MSRIGDLLRQGMADQPDESKSRTDHPEAPPFAGKTFMHPSNMALLAYWRLTRGDQTLPAWAQIDLLEISEHLKNLLMVEWREGHEPVIRFAGPELVNWIGDEPTSRTLSTLLGRDLCSVLPDEVTGLREAQNLLLMQMKYETKTGQSVLLEKLCMPLRDDKGALRYLLIGCQWLNGSFAHGELPDTILPATGAITQKSLLPPNEEECPAEAMEPARRHPWVTRTSSVA